MTTRFTRRDFLEIAGTGALATSTFGATGVLMPGHAAAATACGPLPLPARAVRPRFRWWWCGGYIEPNEIEREVNAMADQGFGGFEIADVRDGLRVPMDPKVYGWGSARWVAGVQRALETANRRGLKADITLGAHWPTGMPGVVPDDDAAAKELVYGAAVVQAGQRFSGQLPITSAPPGGERGYNTGVTITPHLLAVQALRQSAASGSGATVTLEPASLVDLTSQVVGGRLEWTAPVDGPWHLIAYWVRGTGQIQNMFGRGAQTSMLADPIPFVVDIFGKAGAQACIDYWNVHLLPPDTRALLKRIGGCFFEDSFELSAARHWSPDLLAEFQRRRGYELKPLLAALAPAAGGGGGFFGPPPAAPYALAGVDSERLMYDFERTLGEMYVDNRIRPLQTWAATLNMGLRAQAIGDSIDAGTAAAMLTVPEGDNSCDIDGFRVLAAGRDFGGRPLLSDEAATFVGGQSHVALWKLMLFMVQRDYAGGVNQTVLHGFSYADSPDAVWPGFSAFGRAIGNDWGPRSPQWQLGADISAYMSRLQAVLQTGKARTDVAILNPGGGVAVKFTDLGLMNAGYTYQFPTPALLQRTDAVIHDRRLAPQGPAYQALVINDAPVLEVDTARRLLQYAKAGFPIIVVGNTPQRIAGLRNAAQDDLALRQLFAELLRQPAVRQVRTEADIAAALKESGVVPSLGFSRPARVTGLHREDGQARYFYLLNDSDAGVDLTVSFLGEGIPYRIDCWTGDVHPIAVYQTGNGRIEVPMSFAPNEAAVVVVTRDRRFCAAVPRVHATQADGDWRIIDGALAVRTSTAGQFSAHLSNGRRVTARAAAVPAPVELPSWQLTVEDWQPGSTATTTRKVMHELALPRLTAWADIAELRPVSGIGRYVTTATLPADWHADQGAWLDLGKVGGTFRVFINGRQLPPANQFSQRVDVGPYLKPGDNRIEVLVATTLNNRLLANGIGSNFGRPAAAGAAAAASGAPPPTPAAATPSPAENTVDAVYGPPATGLAYGAPVIHNTGAGPRLNPGEGDPGGQRQEQDYGLIGPVRLIPYLDVRVTV